MSDYTDRDLAMARAFWPVSEECGFHRALAAQFATAREEGCDEATADIVRYLQRVSIRLDGQAERVLDACIEAIEGGAHHGEGR